MDTIETFDKNEIYISIFCYTTRPCIHHVVVDGIGKRMNGDEIVELFRSRNLPIPGHFAYLNTEPIPKDPDGIRKTSEEINIELSKKVTVYPPPVGQYGEFHDLWNYLCIKNDL